MQSYKAAFSRFLQSNPQRLHMAAHSHHLWPDCSLQAHQQAWDLAARRIDEKWGTVFNEIIPAAQQHISRQLSLPDAENICFAPNTHELVVRLVSCLPEPCRILTTDSEFHSFARQTRRWREAGKAAITTIDTEPHATFVERFLSEARKDEYDLIYLSQVFFNSGFVFSALEELAQVAEKSSALFAIDGYHGFMALPTELSKATECFYLAGGYKYAMSGEGACFMYCPPGKGKRPVNTGWFAGFGELEEGGENVGYASGGMRFFGATFDISGLCRFNAVQSWLLDEGITVAAIHDRVQSLQQRFLSQLEAENIEIGELLPAAEATERGHFLTFRTESAARINKTLADLDVVVDYRGDRLRFGFGLYHDAHDVDELILRLRKAELQAL